MAEQNKKMTRKEKIAAGLPKPPKRSTVRAAERKAKRQEEVAAQLRNNPIAPRKMRLVIDLIRGMEVDHALNVLKFTPKAGAPYVRKLLLSAISNWENKNEGSRLEDSGLYVKEAYVDGARMLKRFRPAPQGRAHRIRKRYCHVTLKLGSKENLN